LAPAFVAAVNVPLVQGVVWSPPVTVNAPMSASILVVQDALAVCAPAFGLIAQKIIVRSVVVAPESVPLTSVAVFPPHVAVIAVAVFAAIASMTMQTRFDPLPTVNG